MHSPDFISNQPKSEQLLFKTTQTITWPFTPRIETTVSMPGPGEYIDMKVVLVFGSSASGVFTLGQTVGLTYNFSNVSNNTAEITFRALNRGSKIKTWAFGTLGSSLLPTVHAGSNGGIVDTSPNLYLHCKMPSIAPGGRTVDMVSCTVTKYSPNLITP